MNWKITHEKALRIGNNFKRSESDLIEILQEVDREKVYLHLGVTSLFKYCVDVLRLTEEQSLTYIRIARVSVKVPAVKEAIENNSLSISNAKKIASVITEENQTEWIEKGQTLSSRELEKEIVKVHPEKILPEKIKPITESLYELRCLLTPEAEALLKRALDIVSKGMGETLEEVLKDYVERHDPVRKAERALAKNPRLVTGPAIREGKRTAIPKAVYHTVMKESGGKCAKCSSRRYLNVHHCEPAAYGGKHEPLNLQVLCSAHHKLEHFR